MKLMSTDIVAVYSADQCTLFPFSHQSDVDDFLMCCRSSVTPTLDELKNIQRDIGFKRGEVYSSSNITYIKHIYIVVPEHWLLITQHKLDYSVPTELLQLAALSYAAEVTFTPPETVLFDYHVEPSSDHHTCLTVHACSKRWEEALFEPFRQWGGSCILMSYGQWRTRKKGIMSRIFRPSYKGLCSYDPEHKRIQENGKRWRYVLLFSLVIHTVCYCAVQKITEQGEKIESRIQTAQERQKDWPSNSSGHNFTGFVLALSQGLPSSVRLEQVQARPHKASFKITLSASEWKPIFNTWQKQHPKWHWEVLSLTESTDNSEKAREVIDVVLTVSNKSHS